MADATQTAADVLKSTSAKSSIITFGATVTQGNVVYKKSADSEYYPAACDVDAETAGSNGVGISITAGANGQPGLIVTVDSDFDPGFSATEGVLYCLSATAGGKWAPSTDLVTGDYIVELGRGKSNGNVDLNVKYTGTQVQ